MGIKRTDAEVVTRWNVIVMEVDAETGALIQAQRIHNVVTDEGIQEIGRRVALIAPEGEDQFAVGTGTTAATTSDTTLETETYRANVSAEEGGSSGATFRFVLPSTACNGTTITEIGLLQYDDTLLARAILDTPITKTSGKAVAFVWNWTFMEATDLNASIISIADAGGYFTATEVEAALQELALSSRGTVVADVTLDGAWNSGATVDASANTITVASATGLTNGTPIEFRANTGVLPAGITAYTNGAKGIGDGDYFNIINLSGTTFQICATVGGTTPVDITDAGTAGWQWRIAGANNISLATGLDLDSHVEYEVYAFLPMAKKTTSSVSISIRWNYDTYTQFTYFAPVPSWGWSLSAGSTPGTTKKYSMLTIYGRLRKIDAGLMEWDCVGAGVDTDNRSAGTQLTTNTFQSLCRYTPQNVTQILFFTGNDIAGLIRTGARFVIVRRGA